MRASANRDTARLSKMAKSAVRQQWLHMSWRQLPEQVPVTQEHVQDPALVLATHGPSADQIKKSNHVHVTDDPWYIWSGLCTSGWGVSLSPRSGATADLRGGAVTARTYQAGRTLRVLLQLASGEWVGTVQGFGHSEGWVVGTLELDLCSWQNIDITTVTAHGAALDVVDLAAVRAVGFTDLHPGERSSICSRLDWLTVFLAPGGLARDIQPPTRPDGPGMDFHTYSALGLDKRMDAKNVGPPNPNEANDPAVAAMMAERTRIHEAHNAQHGGHEPYELGPDSLPRAGIPPGQLVSHCGWEAPPGSVYPGTSRDWWYVRDRGGPRRPNDNSSTASIVVRPN